MLRIIPPVEVQSNLQKLTSVAKNLNNLSDQLTREVSEIEAAINRLNLGISASVRTESWASEDGDHSEIWRLAYGKEAGKWGLFIECITEDLTRGPDDAYESWLFKDAPREHRMKAVQKIPSLLEALVKTATEVADDIAQKVGYAKDLASKITKPEPEGSRK